MCKFTARSPVNLLARIKTIYKSQDIAAGLLLSSLLLVVLIPAVNRLDSFLLTSLWSPLLVISISVLAIVYHPQSDKWTPTRFVSFS